VTAAPDQAGTAVVVVVAVVAWMNVVQLVPARWRDVVAPAGVVLAALVGAAWLVAVAPPWVGVAAAVPWTLVALAAGSAVVAVVRSRPRLGARLADQRIRAMSRTEFRRHVLVRIPVLVALPEEILFRGVVWAVLAGTGGDLVAHVGSSIAFGLAHVSGASAQARREGHGTARWVAVTVLVTTLAGLALGALRWSTGGIGASVGVHAAVNATAAWAARRPPGGTATPPTP